MRLRLVVCLARSIAIASCSGFWLSGRSSTWRPFSRTNRFNVTSSPKRATTMVRDTGRIPVALRDFRLAPPDVGSCRNSGSPGPAPERSSRPAPCDFRDDHLPGIHFRLPFLAFACLPSRTPSEDSVDRRCTYAPSPPSVYSKRRSGSSGVRSGAGLWRGASGAVYAPLGAAPHPAGITSAPARACL